MNNTSGRAGKTACLIQESVKNGACILCHTQADVLRLRSVANRMGLVIPPPLIYDDFIQNYSNRK